MNSTKAITHCKDESFDSFILFHLRFNLDGDSDSGCWQATQWTNTPTTLLILQRL